MFHQKRSRAAILLAIIGLLFIVPFTTACGDELFLFVSTDSAGTVDGVDYSREDILGFDGDDWFMYFDGSEHELEAGKHDIEAFSVPISETLISGTTDIYISFYQNKVMVDGLGQVMGQDVIKFSEAISPSTGYSYERFFDGSDVGLSTVSEKIDGLEVFPFEFDPCVAVLITSTFGEFSIPAKFTDGAGKLTGEGSDLLLFCATAVGADTEGFWFGFFDGSVEGMPKNYLDSLGLFFEAFLFTTPGAFAVDDAFGGHSEVFGWDGEFFGPIFSAPDEGLTAFVDGLSMMFVEDGPFSPFAPGQAGPQSLEDLAQRLGATYGNR